MVGQFEVSINGLGAYLVRASIYRDRTYKEDFTCEVDIEAVKKYDQFTHSYLIHELDDNELFLIEKEIATRFLNNLH